MDELGHPGRREAMVAVAVAVIVVLVAWVMSRGGDTAPAGDLTELAGKADSSIVSLDVSPDVTADQVAACQPGTAEVAYAEVQKTSTSTVPVLIVTTPDGQLHLCDSFGADVPSVSPVEYADAAHAVRLLSNGRQSWDCEGTRLSGLTISHWLSVSAAVDTVQLRFLIDGASGPWFSTQAHGGFAHVHAWLGKQNPGAQVQMQVRVLDSEGEAVPQDIFPTTPTPLSGCTGGSVQLG